jgi:hypothetical protein
MPPRGTDGGVVESVTITDPCVAVSLDEDADGVSDHLDLCPGTLAIETKADALPGMGPEALSPWERGTRGRYQSDRYRKPTPLPYSRLSRNSTGTRAA